MSHRKRNTRVVVEKRASPRSRPKLVGKRKKTRQTELDFRSWGGARKGAGRKRTSDRPQVPHVVRPRHTARFPVLVTSRLVPGLPSLRRTSEARLVVAAIARSQRTAVSTLGRPPFQIVHYSIQSNHLHLIVEAQDRRRLSSGLRGLLIRIAFALNRLWKRHGSVFAGRFHERELLDPRQVRNALVYVLNNSRKHGVRHAGPDPLSSGPRFDGWITGEDERIEEQRSIAARKSPLPRGPVAADHASRATRFGGNAALGGRAGASLSFQRAARSQLARASTWLLAEGWKRKGLIDLWESPRGS